MCNLCNGTHVVHEIDSYSIRTCCCPACGPEPDESWYGRLKAFKERSAEMRKKAEETYEFANH
ncbi:hypothetical protein [Bacillus sp. ISL-46]|uniref:hypothetical protein n=1 Tax=Bacillus sp. ISL-46 TaxID=2819129 RepID=UPI001BE50805|nr:hypothetical protein [Bacillus sp. ISL-46]MBT2722284.1 hypothetical protein [Bacillus sp. ISL-46]